MKKRKNEAICIDRIEVINLFDMFSYDIDLNNGNDISILIAPNGCGKTTIFEIIKTIFNPVKKDLAKITNIPFESVTLHFSNGKSLSLIKLPFTTDLKIETGDSYIILDGWKDDVISICRVRPSNERVDRTEYQCVIAKNIDEDSPFAPFYGSMDIPKGIDEDLPFAMPRDAINKKKSIKRIETEKSPIEVYKDFLIQNEVYVNIQFISTNRLYDYEIQEDSISLFEKNIENKFAKLISEYHELRSNAANMLPIVYLNMDSNTSIDTKKIRDEWIGYQKKASLYQNYLSYTNNQVPETNAFLDTINIEQKIEDKWDFIAAYLSLFSETTKGLDSFGRKMDLLINIFNERNSITKKELIFDTSAGYFILSCNGNTIPLSCLSSGEKNDLLMFYKLIFFAEQNKTVLIDEPEISLHIEWQERYIDDLLEICKLNNMRAIVATHSPNIVNGHFELYAERGLINED